MVLKVVFVLLPELDNKTVCSALWTGSGMFVFG